MDEREHFIDYCAREMAVTTTAPSDVILYAPRDGDEEDVTAEVLRRARAIRDSWSPEQLAAFEGRLASLLQ